MKCSIKGCPHEANAGDKCWEHCQAGYQEIVINKWGEQILHPMVDIPPQPTADVDISLAEEKSVLELEQEVLKLRYENEELRKGNMPISVAWKFNGWSIVGFITGSVFMFLLKGC